MNKFSWILLIGMLLMFLGTRSVARLSETAIGLGFDGTVIDNKNAPQRLLMVGLVGTRIASELIRRGEYTVIVNDEDRPLMDDKRNARNPREFAK
jgi:hypothetical protein